MSEVRIPVCRPFETLNALHQFLNRFRPLHTGDITSWVVIDGDTHEEIIRMSTREEEREHIRSLGCNARLGCTRVAK